MWRRGLRAVVGLVSVTLFAGAGAPATGQSLGRPWDLQPVQDNAGRFAISVPLTWRVNYPPKNPALSVKSPEPPGTSPDTVEVFVRDMMFALSPEGCAQQVAFVMRITIRQWTTLSEGPDSIGGLAAYSRAYTWHLTTGEGRRSIQTCVTLGRRVFVIIGTTMNTPDRVAQNLPEITRIIGTFRPGPTPPEPAPETQGPSAEH